MDWLVGFYGPSHVPIEFRFLKGSATRLAIATLVVFRLNLNPVFVPPSSLVFFLVSQRQPTIQELYS